MLHSDRKHSHRVTANTALVSGSAAIWEGNAGLSIAVQATGWEKGVNLRVVKIKIKKKKITLKVSQDFFSLRTT